MQTITPIIGKEFAEIATRLIESANADIKIIVFDWRWYPNDPAAPCQLFNRAIISAARRGVNVKAIVNSDEIVKILAPEKVKIKRLVTGRVLHTKMMIVDEKHIIIGSHNYTQNAMTINYEVSVMIENCESVQRFIDYFNHLY